MLLSQEDQVLQNDTRVRLLVGERQPDPREWPYDSQVLLLESEPAVARLHAAQLESLGCTAYKTNAFDLALRLLEANPQVGIVIVDLALCGDDPAEAVNRLRAVRKGIRLVGNDRTGVPGTFRDAGLAHFLPKPWRVTDLIHVE